MNRVCPGQTHLRRVCPGRTLLRRVCPGQTLLRWVRPGQTLSSYLERTLMNGVCIGHAHIRGVFSRRRMFSSARGTCRKVCCSAVCSLIFLRGYLSQLRMLYTRVDSLLFY